MEIKDCHGMLTTHGWKILEKVIQAVPFLDIVHQGLNRNTGSRKQQRSLSTFAGTRDQGIRYRT